jgi:hypothetical protein
MLAAAYAARLMASPLYRWDPVRGEMVPAVPDLYEIEARAVFTDHMTRTTPHSRKA